MWHTQNKNFTPKLKENNPEKKKNYFKNQRKTFCFTCLVFS